MKLRHPLSAKQLARGFATSADTDRDKKLGGPDRLFRGWLKFCGACSVGAFANVAVATVLNDQGVLWWVAALVGVVIASVWNYALSSKFV